MSEFGHIPAVSTAAKDGRSRLESGRWRSAARWLPERERASLSLIRRSSGCSAPTRPLSSPPVRHGSADARHGSCWAGAGSAGCRMARNIRLPAFGSGEPECEESDHRQPLRACREWPREPAPKAGLRKGLAESRVCGGEERRDRVSLGRREGRPVAGIGSQTHSFADCHLLEI